MEIDRPGPIAEKRILVTGGTQGIGRALAEAFLRDGARVATCARAQDGPSGALFIRTDVSRPYAVDDLIGTIRKAWGGLDALVNNAAILRPGNLLDLELRDWEETLAVNLTGPLLVTRAAARIMPEGNVVNLTSGLGSFVLEPYNAYGVSKAGLNLLTRALAGELAPTVRVNAVDPGVARTRMNPSAESPAEAVVPVVRALVALGPGGPTGKCFRKDGRETDWD